MIDIEELQRKARSQVEELQLRQPADRFEELSIRIEAAVIALDSLANICQHLAERIEKLEQRNEGDDTHRREQAERT